MQTDAVPDVLHRRPGPLLEAVEVAHRLWDPVLQYAMIEQAFRKARGRTLDEGRGRVAALWADFNRVARHNPAASFPAPMEPSAIATPSPTNRPLAFPYNRWHASQWTVDQAAALLVCSVESARRFGIATDRWLFPLVGLESSHAVSLVSRAEPHRWPAMEVLALAASERLGRPVGDAEWIELYSCFPAAVEVQQRAIGVDPSRTPTVTGGMSFAGGPFNNFVYQAMGAMVPILRDDPGSLGVVTTVSGLLTKPAIGVWSTEPDGRPPLVADLAADAEAATRALDAVETLEGYAGHARVVTYTVTYDGMDPVRTVVIADTDDGRRCVGVSDDTDLAHLAVEHDLVGSDGKIVEGTFIWSRDTGTGRPTRRIP